MAIIRKDAVRLRQGENTLFLTEFTVAELRQKGFFQIDKLDISKEQGYQRVLNESRAKELARDLTQANQDEKNAAFLPTSVFFATGEKIEYDEQAKQIVFDTASAVCPFDVVDGQHRISGLLAAAENDPSFENFPLPVSIATELNDAEKMLQFLVVNTKQRPVDKGVSQHIVSRFTDMDKFKDIPYLPAWVSRMVKAGSDSKALEIAKFLNSEEDSPWFGRIQMADDGEKSRGRIKQSSFVNCVKTYILSANNPLSNCEKDFRHKFLKNYWVAIANIFWDKESDNVIFKTVGVNFFLSLSAVIVRKCLDDDDYRVQMIEGHFNAARDSLGSGDQVVFEPEWWVTGKGEASGMNNYAIANLSKRFHDAFDSSAKEYKGVRF